MSIDQILLSCRTLQELVGFIEGALNVKEHAMVIFLDIEGNFNNINPSAISVNEHIMGLGFGYSGVKKSLSDLHTAIHLREE